MSEIEEEIHCKLNCELYQEAVAYAAEDGKTFKELMMGLLMDYIERKRTGMNLDEQSLMKLLDDPKFQQKFREILL